ncbi:MAG: STAS domain-containing protein, partial [Desulfatirhabdiaceae bacterium]
TWYDFFLETILKYIRNGEHHLIIDASEMSYISSMGIRALMIIHRELGRVNGRFQIVDAPDFVRSILETTGFDCWLADAVPSDSPGQTHAAPEQTGLSGMTHFILNQTGKLILRQVHAWEPWNTIETGKIQRISFSETDFGLGIGVASPDLKSALPHFGEFLTASGHVICQPPDERGRADFLLREGTFVPELLCIQALAFSGDMSHLIRFESSDKIPANAVSHIIDQALEVTGSHMIGFVMLGEVDGLVGASLIRSPGEIGHAIAFPELRDWLSFSSERMYVHEQALITGIAARGQSVENHRRLSPLPSRPDLAVHMHAAVFPYQPIPNGLLDIQTTVNRFFNGPSPRAVIHLIDDARPDRPGRKRIDSRCMLVRPDRSPGGIRMSLVISAFTMGLILSLLSLGMLITFRMIRFTDITVDGSLTLGASLAAVLIARGVNPWLATLAAAGAGGVAGYMTGILHTRFKIQELLSGILVMTALYSINLRVMGKSNVPLLNVSTVSLKLETLMIQASGGTDRLNILGWMAPVSDIAVFLSTLVICVTIGILLYRFLMSHFGTALRAAGSNPQMVLAMGINDKTMIVFSLILANALVALAGSLLAQYQGFADVQMGIGMMVWGLASIIIGESLVGRDRIGLSICGTILGTILFRLLIAIALRWGLNPNDLKLVTALFVFAALVAPSGLASLRQKFSTGNPSC